MSTTDLLDLARGVLSTTVERWQRLVETLPEELMERRPAPDEWSPAECLGHLLLVERRMLSVRLRDILDGRAELVPYDPMAARPPEAEHTPRELVAALAEARRATLAALAGLVPADLERSSHHPEFGATVTVAHLLNVWAAHDLQHTRQAEEALMQPFIPGTGVWRYEFADSDREARARPA
jgi:DinB superfamily